MARDTDGSTWKGTLMDKAGFALLTLGISMADSEKLIVPAMMVLVGAVMMMGRKC